MQKKWIAGLMATALTAGVLAGCGGTKEAPKTQTPATTQEQPKANPVNVVVWSNATEAEQAEILKHAQAWGKKTGNTVEVVNIQTGFQEAAAAIQAGKGPDVHYGIIHDNLGTYHKAGFLDPVPAGIINTADYEKLTIDAVSFDGKMYAVPYGFESIGLIYNKAKVKDAPKTWDEFVKVAKDQGFAFDIKNFYFAYGFMGGSGGYVFKSNGGALDPKDVGLGNDGAKAGLKILDELVNTHKFMPADVNGEMAKGMFVSGKTGLYLSGPWDIKDIKDAKIDVGVAPMPNMPNGKPFTPFVGVASAYVNAQSKIKTQAWDLVKYLQENGQPDLYKAGNRFPALKKHAESDVVKSNVINAGFGASAKNGVPMPNIPAMQAVWGPAGNMLTAVVEKKATVDVAAAEALKAINEAVAAQK